jgi:voltage-gated potassium channel
VGPAGILISEESRFRTRWDVFVVLLVIVTGIAIPLQIAFVREVTLGGSVLVYLLDLVFLVDIGLNFRTTYRAGGAEVRDPGRIGARYRRSLLPLDVVSTVPLDMLLLGSGAVIGGVPAVLLLRALRLLRIVRLFSIVRRWERLRWTNTGYLRIAKLVLGVFLLIHWIACGWFLVAVLEGFPENSWVVLAGIHDLDAGSQYLRSLYWGFVTTTTVGYGDITPHRNLEYAFTVLVMVLGASMYALIIGSIASLVSSVDSAKSGFWNRVDGLNQYLRTRDLPPELYDQIQDYHDYIWDRYRGVSAKEFLSDLPDSLRLEVLFHLTSDLIDRVPLFRHAEEAMRNALLMALEPQVYVPGSHVVREGELGNGIYFVSRGQLTIASEGGTRSHGDLAPGDYFGDLSLLLGERRTASVQALTNCDVLHLSTAEFNRLKDEYSEFRDLLKTISSEKSEKLAALVLDGCVL